MTPVQALLPLFVFFAFVSTSDGIKCFLDTTGIPEPKPNEVVNTTLFRHFDCSLLGGEEKVSIKTGVDVMITIFCDFFQFSAKKLAFFLNANVTIKLF
jgi:hypothetical protein